MEMNHSLEQKWFVIGLRKTQKWNEMLLCYNCDKKII